MACGVAAGSRVTPNRRQIRAIRRSARSEGIPSGGRFLDQCGMSARSSRLNPLSANSAKLSNDSSASCARVRS